jgi:hypothetical protein
VVARVCEASEGRGIISKEVRKLTTPEAQQAYINALTEQEAVAFAVYLLR